MFPSGTTKLCCALAGLFALSRLVCYAAGVRFVADLDNLIQIADTLLLREDLFRTVLLLHYQPPLFNLFIGLVCKIFPDNFILVFQLIYLALGLCLCIAVFLLGIRLGLGRKWAFALSGVFTVTPATILLENWAFYSYPVALLLVLAALALNFFAETRKLVWLFCLFLLLATVVLTRSMFHPLWLLLVSGALWLLLPECRRRIVTAALIPLLVVGLWMAKNYYTVGGFTTSTLLGMNMSKITIMQLSGPERVRLYSQQKMSVAGLYSPFESLDYYRANFKDIAGYLPSGIPILDNERTAGGAPNFNHPAYVDISRRFLHDDLSVVRYRPAAYIGGVFGALSLYVQPPHDQIFNPENVKKIAPWVRVSDVILYGQLSSLWRDNYHTEFKSRIRLSESLPDIGLFVLAALLAIALYWPAALARGGLEGLRGPRGITALFMFFTVAYVSGVVNLLEIGENARIRYEIEPLIWLLAASAFSSMRKLPPECDPDGA